MIDIKKVLGVEFEIEELNNSIQLITTSDSKYLIKRKSCYSNKEAIKAISKYGISKIVAVNDEQIIETYNPFEKQDISLMDFVTIARQIHQTQNELGLPLVHGDLSRYNTTLVNDTPFCFDYEHSHWGNPFADLGRILLRECKTFEDDLFFLHNYFNGILNINNLQKGIVYFCEWQHKIRKEKNLSYSEVPLIRRERVLKSDLDLENIMYEFKREI